MCLPPVRPNHEHDGRLADFDCVAKSAPVFISNIERNSSFARTSVLRVAAVSSLRKMRERGAWVSAVGSSCASLRWLMRVSHAPRERPFFPARVHWSCCDSPGVRAPRGLSSKPCAGAVVQGFVTEPPWTLRFQSPEALPSEFASPRNQHGSAASSLLGHAPVATGFLARLTRPCSHGPDALTATPAAALSSRSFGRPRNLPPKGRGHYAGGFSPKDKVRFWIRADSRHRLGVGAESFFRSVGKIGGFGPRNPPISRRVGARACAPRCGTLRVSCQPRERWRSTSLAW